MANRKNKISNNRIQQTTKVDPKVNDGGEVIDVPVIYGSPERWKSVQKGGTYRDMKSGKLQIPLIMYRRTGMERVEGMMGNKIDAADPTSIVRQFATRYNPKNRYDRWNILQGQKPSRESYSVVQHILSIQRRRM